MSVLYTRYKTPSNVLNETVKESGQLPIITDIHTLGGFLLSKKNASLTVNADLSDLFTEKPPKQQRPLVTKGMPIEKALFTITRHMEATGFRERTISDSTLHTSKK